MTSWRHVITEMKNQLQIWTQWPKNHRNKKRINFLAHLQAEIGKSGFCDVMTWRHDVTASYKWKINNNFELYDSKYHRNEKRIIFLAHLQAKICIVSSVTSWRHVETLWRHVTWHLDNFIQPIVLRDDFSITSENFTNISSIGKKLRHF